MTLDLDLRAVIAERGRAGQLEVPHDAWSEAAVVGCAIASLYGATLAKGRIEAQDIWDPRLRRMFEAALKVELSGQDERIEAVAAEIGIPAVEIARVVDDRPAQWDSSGGFAARVLDAAKRRAVMQHAAELHNALGRGARLEEIAPQVSRIEAALACQ